MKVKLSIKQRLDLNGIFPEKTSFLDRQIAFDIRKKVEIKKEEQKRLSMGMIGTKIKWDSSKEESNEIDFTNAEIGYMKSCVEKLDKAEHITDANFHICKLIKGLSND